MNFVLLGQGSCFSLVNQLLTVASLIYLKKKTDDGGIGLTSNEQISPNVPLTNAKKTGYLDIMMPPSNGERWTRRAHVVDSGRAAVSCVVNTHSLE